MEKLIKKLSFLNFWDSLVNKEKSIQEFPRGDEKPVLLISGQKTGTHLIKEILNNVGLEEASLVNAKNRVSKDDLAQLNRGEYIWSHVIPHASVYSLLGNDLCKIILNIRDPRDVIVSNYYWVFNVIEKDPATFQSQGIRRFREAIHENLDDKQKSFQIMARTIKLTPNEQTINDWFRDTISLYLHPKVFTTRYEILNGSLGEKEQTNMISELCDYLNIENRNIEQIRDQSVSKNTKTYRKGKSGEYKNEFSKQTLELFQRLHGDLLEIFGYDLLE